MVVCVIYSGVDLYWRRCALWGVGLNVTVGRYVSRAVYIGVCVILWRALENHIGRNYIGHNYIGHTYICGVR